MYVSQRNPRPAALGKQPCDVLNLMRIGIGGHVRPMNLGGIGGIGRNDNSLLGRNRIGHFHLRHVRHAAFHRPLLHFARLIPRCFYSLVMNITSDN